MTMTGICRCGSETFDPLRGVKLQLKSRENIVKYADSGLDPTGVLDSSGAFAALEARSPAGLLPAGTYRIAESLTLHSRWRFEPGAIIRPDPGASVSIQSPFEAGIYQVFDTSLGGSISLGHGAALQVYPQWWGALGDGSNDDTAALQQAFNRGGWIVLLPGIYRTTGELTVPNNTKIEGSGNPWSVDMGRSDVCIRYEGTPSPTRCVLRVSAAAPGTEPSSARSNVHLSGFTLDGGGFAGYGLYGAFITNDSVLQDITAIRTTQHGIRLEKMWYARVTGLIARNNRGCGITIGRYGWGGVNGIVFTNLRGHSNGTDQTFHATDNLEWGYGIGFYPGAGTTLSGAVCEQNYGVGLLVGMGVLPVNTVRDTYLEGNCITAQQMGRAARNYGLAVVGHTEGRGLELDSVYLAGATTQTNAQAILLTGPRPYAGPTLRNVALGHYLDADWDNYKLEGFVSFGLTGARGVQAPARVRNVLFHKDDVNLNFTSSFDYTEGFTGGKPYRLRLFFIPNVSATPVNDTIIRLVARHSMSTVLLEWTISGALEQGEVHTSLSIPHPGFQQVRIIAATSSGVSIPGTVGLLHNEPLEHGTYEI